MSEPSISRQFALGPDPQTTERLGRLLGAQLTGGQGVALIGELGAGKTTLARGIAVGLGVDDPGAVTSPTYLIAIEHAAARHPMVHVDAYLPEKTRAFLMDGGVDYFDELAGVLVVEWADRVRDLLPDETLEVELRPRADGAAGRDVLLRGSPVFSWILAVDGVADES